LLEFEPIIADSKIKDRPGRSGREARKRVRRHTLRESPAKPSCKVSHHKPFPPPACESPTAIFRSPCECPCPGQDTSVPVPCLDAVFVVDFVPNHASGPNASDAGVLGFDEVDEAYSTQTLFVLCQSLARAERCRRGSLGIREWPVRYVVRYHPRANQRAPSTLSRGRTCRPSLEEFPAPFPPNSKRAGRCLRTAGRHEWSERRTLGGKATFFRMTQAARKPSTDVPPREACTGKTSISRYLNGRVRRVVDRICANA